jgi:hypothetical protein
MLRVLSIVIVIAAHTVNARAADAQPADSAVSSVKVQDNSFLLEEAYNQEAGVVQHIGSLVTRRGSKDLEFGFTQEWPVGSMLHQLSYDIPILRLGSGTGVGDIAFNYRYQLLGDGDAAIALTPRVTLLAPTGDWKRGRGNGGPGGEIAMAASVVVLPWLSTHTNAGISIIPSARNSAGAKAGIHQWSVAQSAILTSSRRIQPMLEAVYSRGTEVTDDDRTSSIESFVLAPGARMAINFDSGLQIVPGLAVPIGIGPAGGERGVLFYLSLEHAFRR